MIAIESDNVVTLNNLQTANGTVINSAVVTGQLADSSGKVIYGWPMPSIGSGSYSGVLPVTKTALLAPGTYTIIVMAVSTYGTLTLQQTDTAAFVQG
jgi:hypothetical protein